MAKMDERLEKMVERYREINDLMMQSDVVSDRKTMAKLGREQNELTPIVETYEEYKKAVEELEEAKVLSKEEDKTRQPLLSSCGKRRTHRANSKRFGKTGLPSLLLPPGAAGACLLDSA